MASINKSERRKRQAMLSVRVAPAGLAMVDQFRGDQTRGEYVRALIAADAKRRGVNVNTG